MKKFFSIAVIFLSVALHAQETKFRHFEIEAGVGLWTPISPDLMNMSEIYTYHTDLGDYKILNVSGYGYGPAPSLKFLETISALASLLLLYIQKTRLMNL